MGSHFAQEDIWNHLAYIANNYALRENVLSKGRHAPLPPTEAEYAAFWAERDEWVDCDQTASWATNEGVLL